MQLQTEVDLPITQWPPPVAPQWSPIAPSGLQWPIYLQSYFSYSSCVLWVILDQITTVVPFFSAVVFLFLKMKTWNASQK